MDGKIDTRLETCLQGFKNYFKGEIRSKLQALRSELHGLFEQYFGSLIVSSSSWSLKQHGSVEQYHEEFVGLLNQISLPESHAFCIFASNLQLEISQYMDLFSPQTLGEAFHLARKVECLLSTFHNKGYLPGSNYVARYVSPTKTIHNRPVPLLQTGVHNTTSSSNTTKGPAKGISHALINERKQKRLCFWCGAKYHIGYKCVKGQLYEVLLYTQSNGEGEEF
ncbi:hypothetical protein CXB51_035144 [Gossypium anomalum]|uniref:Retrotransposon gag domain-containing protein n=1 Tax=Gossypium anomalum TaxID=47600 RepID=A0A8J5Y979_9ROSI|nr:hypothetical protein CXB51_035144 [Gossypium anomalum]